MKYEVKPCFCSVEKPAKAVICLSGTGSNAEVLLEHAASQELSFQVALLFTDAPESSAAKRLAAKYNVPMRDLDIRKYYADHGESNIKLDSDHKRQLRRQWSEEVWKILQEFQVDFALFAGFVPLNDLPDKLPCLNVHPGDLTVEKDGARRYAGLHYAPVERAILDGCKYLRSSVILVQNYAGGKDVDAGPVLGISAKVPVTLDGETPESLRRIKEARTAPPYQDKLRTLAEKNIEKLKVCGDHTVFTPAVEAFASGKYALDENGGLYYRKAEKWLPVKTVEFSSDGIAAPVKKAGAIRKSRNFLSRIFKYLYLKMVRGTGSPDYISRGWTLGVIVGCIVPIFCQLVVAIPLSFVVRGSKVGAALGTFVTTPPTAVFIYPIQIWVGSRITGGAISFEEIKKASAAMLQGGDFQAFANMGLELIIAFFAGGILWAAVMAPLTYILVRVLVVRYRRIREAIRSRREAAL